MRRRPILLVVGTGNAARSQMAEAMLRRRIGDRVAVHSAGTDPAAEIHPVARAVMEEEGYDLSGQRPKPVCELLGKAAVHTVILVCEEAARSLPSEVPGAFRRFVWSFEDPTAFVGSERARLETFREIRDRIDDRVNEWIDEESGNRVRRA